MYLWNGREASVAAVQCTRGRILEMESTGLVVVGKDLGFYSEQNENPPEKAEQSSDMVRLVL